MSEFEINVIRHRYVKESEWGRTKCELDEVVIDVDELGRAKVPTNTPLGRGEVRGGTMCYLGWKRLTGVALNPQKLYRLKFSVSQIGDGKFIEYDDNLDLTPIEEALDQEDRQNKAAKEYNDALKKSRAARNNNQTPIE